MNPSIQLTNVFEIGKKLEQVKNKSVEKKGPITDGEFIEIVKGYAK